MTAAGSDGSGEGTNHGAGGTIGIDWDETYMMLTSSIYSFVTQS